MTDTRFDASHNQHTQVILVNRHSGLANLFCSCGAVISEIQIPLVSDWLRVINTPGAGPKLVCVSDDTPLFDAPAPPAPPTPPANSNIPIPEVFLKAFEPPPSVPPTPPEENK